MGFVAVMRAEVVFRKTPLFAGCHLFFIFLYISNRYSRVLNMLLVEGVVNDAYATFLCVFILISSH